MDWDFCDVTLVGSCLVTSRLVSSLVTSLAMSNLVSSSLEQWSLEQWRAVLWKNPCKYFFKGKCCSAGQGGRATHGELLAPIVGHAISCLSLKLESVGHCSRDVNDERGCETTHGEFTH